MQYCSYSIGLYFHPQSHPQLGVVRWLRPFVLSGVISPLISSSILAPADLGSSSFSVTSFCLFYCSWGSQGKNTEVVGQCLLQWTTFVRTLDYDTFVLDGPTWHGS